MCDDYDFPPVNCQYIHVMTPDIRHLDKQTFFIQLCNEALWDWKEILRRPQSFSITTLISKSIEKSLKKSGYQLHPAAMSRIAKVLGPRLSSFVSFMRETKDQRTRKKRRRQWFKISVHPLELAASPKDVIRKMEDQIKELEEVAEDKEEELFLILAEANQLREKVDVLERRSGAAHHGKPFWEVSDKQKTRHIKQIGERAVKALWFAETFGLVPESIAFKSAKNCKNDERIAVPLQSDRCNSGSEENTGGEAKHTGQESTVKPKKSAYVNLPESEKDKVKALLYILDRFSVSMQAYHEISQVLKDAPRSHHLEGCQKWVDSRWLSRINHTPGRVPGAELPFRELLENAIQSRMQQADGARQKFQIKISGDGASMSRTSSLFVCSFSILQDKEKVMSSAGNYTIAVVKASEDYESLRICLGNVIREVNSLVTKGSLDVNGNEVDLEFFLGGDYKFLLLAMGMKSANSKNSCIWCKIHSSERSNLEKPLSFYNSGDTKRELSPHWWKEPGCKGAPLLAIPLDHVVIDELHMLLRITDRLEHGIIMDVIDWDESESNSEQNHLNKLLDTIKSIGVSFNVWRSNGRYEWTSLMGGEKKKILRELPQKFESCLPPNKVEATKRLWVNFRQLHETFTSLEPSEEQIDTFHAQAVQWGKQLLAMTGCGYGQAQQITPYMHIMVYHVPEMLKKYKTIKIFTGQGVEKKNDDFRRYFHRKINRWDACKSLLLLEKRQEVLADQERTKRPYQKKNQAFWLEGGKSEVAKKVPRLQSVEEDTPLIPYSLGQLQKMSLQQLISILSGLGHNGRKKVSKRELIHKIEELAILTDSHGK